MNSYVWGFPCCRSHSYWAAEVSVADLILIVWESIYKGCSLLWNHTQALEALKSRHPDIDEQNKNEHGGDEILLMH